MEDKFPPRHENQNVLDQIRLTAALYHTDENGVFRLRKPKRRGKKIRKQEKRERQAGMKQRRKK